MFLIPFYMALMALGQQGERPCPMVWLSDQIDASVPPPASIYSRFSPVVINLMNRSVFYTSILLRDLQRSVSLEQQTSSSSE